MPTGPGAYPLVGSLPVEDGAGHLATVPDLPGCVSGGDAPAGAAANVRDAIARWIAEASRRRLAIA